MEFLSGLLLTIATLAILAYIVAAIVGSRDRNLKKVGHDLSDALTKYVGSEGKPVNQHMIGATGNVIAHSDDEARPLRVRINLEFWPARPSSADGGSLAVGSSVKVTAVDGPVLVVESDADAVV